MAKLNYIEYFKGALLEFATENDPLYAMLQWMTEKIMQLEAEQKVGAQKGEHSTERATHFSGNWLRRFDTRMGTMYLLVPKLRKGGYILEFPRLCGHPQLHLRLGFGEVSKHHPPSENATTALYAQGFFLSLA